MDEQSLLLLSIVKLKKKCKTLKISSEGSKKDMIQRILDKMGVTTESTGTIPSFVFDTACLDKLNTFDIRMQQILCQWFRESPPLIIGNNDFLFAPPCIQLIASNILSTTDYSSFVDRIFKISSNADSAKIKGIEYEYSGESKSEEESSLIEWTLQIFFNKGNDCFYKGYRSDWNKWDGSEVTTHEGRGHWYVTDFETISIEIKHKGGKRNQKVEFVREKFLLNDLNKINDEECKESVIKFAGDDVIGKYI
eukprot:265355_1